MIIQKLPDWVQDENDLELYHHGIIGQRWGVRRYQNKDGSLTAAGRKRYLGDINKSGINKERYNKAYNEANAVSKKLVNKNDIENSEGLWDLVQFYDCLEVIPSTYFKDKYNNFIDACVIEASKKNKRRK